jgi:hypothetical protein
VTASTVKVVVPVTVVSPVFVRVSVSVFVSRASATEVKVDVLIAVEVTVTVGMLSNDEQNSAPDGTERSSSTRGEMSLHSESLSSLVPGTSSWAELATARDSRSEVMEVRILNRVSDSGPTVGFSSCHWVSR